MAGALAVALLVAALVLLEPEAPATVVVPVLGLGAAAALVEVVVDALVEALAELLPVALAVVTGAEITEVNGTYGRLEAPKYAGTALKDGLS